VTNAAPGAELASREARAGCDTLGVVMPTSVRAPRSVCFLVTVVGCAADARVNEPPRLPPPAPTAAATVAATAAEPPPEIATNVLVSSTVRPPPVLPPPPPDEGPGGLHFCATAVNGTLPAEVILRIIHLNRARFRFCYETALRKDPTVTGRLAVRFVIDRAGSVATAEVDPSSTLTSSDVTSCVTGAFKSLSFPQPEGGVVDVTYPLVFTPKGPPLPGGLRP
jgi:hypothetical protein